MRKKGWLQVGNQPAVGVQTVLVNGEFVVQDGELVLDAPHRQPIRRVLE